MPRHHRRSAGAGGSPLCAREQCVTMRVTPRVTRLIGLASAVAVLTIDTPAAFGCIDSYNNAHGGPPDTCNDGCAGNYVDLRPHNN